jgi:DtxR family Mn-dependent transcriptional regulator
MLRYLAERGISPGDRFLVRERQPFGGPLFVAFGTREHAIGGGLAGAMRVVLDARMKPRRRGADEDRADEHT